MRTKNNTRNAQKKNIHKQYGLEGSGDLEWKERTLKCEYK